MPSLEDFKPRARLDAKSMPSLEDFKPRARLDARSMPSLDYFKPRARLDARKYFFILEQMLTGIRKTCKRL
jgi:hypothetical protein